MPSCLTHLCIMSCFTEQDLEFIVTSHVVILSRKCYMLMDRGMNIVVVGCHYGMHESGRHLSRKIKMTAGKHKASASSSLSISFVSCRNSFHKKMERALVCVAGRQNRRLLRRLM